MKVLEEQSPTFLQEMNSTAIAPTLRGLGLIPARVSNGIQRSECREDANQCLLTFLKEDATEEQVLCVFRSASEEKSFGRMHKFAADILQQLQRGLCMPQQGTLASSLTACTAGIGMICIVAPMLVWTCVVCVCVCVCVCMCVHACT